MRIGALLKTYRIAERYSLREMAKLIGVPTPTLHRIEGDKPMDGATLAKILAWAMGDGGKG